jgi:hypothetical protein
MAIADYTLITDVGITDVVIADALPDPDITAWA